MSVLAELQRLSAAEDFFNLLGVPYDAAVLGPARLHILKRMGQYLNSEDMSGLSDEVVTGRCRTILERAYNDFITSSPIEQRVFKVLKDAVEPKKKPFVALEDLQVGDA